MRQKYESPTSEIDHLSRFLSDSEYNCQGHISTFVPLYSGIRDVDEIWRYVVEEVISYRPGNTLVSEQALLISRFLTVHSWSCFRAAIRLTLAGQSVQAVPIIRLMIEHALYALFIAKDPSPPHRAIVHLERSKSAESRKTCTRTFAMDKLRTEYRRLSGSSAEEGLALYDRLIDLGAHPNEFALSASITHETFPEKEVFAVGVLNPRPELVHFGAKLATYAALQALTMVEMIFPESFAQSSASERLIVLKSLNPRPFPSANM